jgi:tetratricopeptide (TPR) repeat protein
MGLVLESPSRYNLVVKRLLILALLLACACWAQQSKPQQQEPPEEDEALTPKEYTFNPLQANKELQIGNYYFKRKNYRAAAKRFTEATRWNPTFAEAFLRLGESEDKLKDPAAARQAYSKYLELAPDAKNAEDIKKRLTKGGGGRT